MRGARGCWWRGKEGESAACKGDVGLVALAVARCACGRDGASGDSAAVPARLPKAIVVPPDDATCFLSPESVLLGASAGRRNVGHPPGWIRLVGLARATGGVADLLAANGSGFAGEWDRIARESLRVVGSYDFLRTELRVAITSDSLFGQGTPHSDADFELDSAGRQGELRRAWRVIARRVPCDSMPRR